MPYELTREPFCVYKRLSWFVSADEFLESVAAVEDAPRFHEVRYVINDFSGATGQALTEADFIQLAMCKHNAHAKNPRCRIFYVAADEALVRLDRSTWSTARSPATRSSWWPRCTKRGTGRRPGPASFD